MKYLFPGKGKSITVDSYLIMGDGDHQRKVFLYNDFELALLFSSAKMKEWLWRVEGFDITYMVVTEVVGKLHAPLFVSISFDVTGVPFRICARIRGDSMGINVMLKDEETGSVYTLLVHQSREPAGFAQAHELTAGMGDGASNILWPASKEIWDELGIRKVIPVHMMQWIGWIASSQGFLDEIVHIFNLKLILSREQIMKLHNRQTGDENEKILVRVIPDSTESRLKYAEGDPKATEAAIRILFPHFKPSLPEFNNVSEPIHDWNFNFDPVDWVHIDSLEDAPVLES